MGHIIIVRNIMGVEILEGWWKIWEI